MRSVAGYNPTSGKNAEINISEGPKPKTPKNLSRNADEDASTDDDEIYDDTNKNNNRKVPTSPSSRTVDRSQMVMASDCRLQFHVFDLPVYDGKDLSKLPYYARRTMLAHILRADSDTDGQDAPDASGIGNSSANSGADAASAAGAASDVAAGGAPSWESEDILWDEDDIPAVNTANHRNSHANGGNQNISSTRDTSNPAIDVSGRDGALGDDELDDLLDDLHVGVFQEPLFEESDALFAGLSQHGRTGSFGLEQQVASQAGIQYSTPAA